MMRVSIEPPTSIALVKVCVSDAPIKKVAKLSGGVASLTQSY